MFRYEGNRLGGNGMSKTNGNFKKVFICLMAVVFAIGAVSKSELLSLLDFSFEISNKFCVINLIDL